MTLDESTCWVLLGAGRHGVLCTVHPSRGVDAVPTVYAPMPGGRIVVPIDTVKPKRRTSLQRSRNLAMDPRCLLLVDHYDDDWSTLWWVRAHASGAAAPVTDELAGALAARYPQYRTPGSIAAAVLLDVHTLTGWATRDPGVR